MWVPGLNLILWAADMDRTDRVKETDDPDVDGMARARAILQFHETAEKREQDGALSTIFTPGTRSRVAGVGPPKKGSANQAIDTDALILSLSLFGPSQIMNPSWGRFFRRGGGTNREIHVGATLIDPRNISAEEGANSALARKERVAKISTAIFNAQVRSHLAILEN